LCYPFSIRLDQGYTISNDQQYCIKGSVKIHSRVLDLGQLVI
jgi:hypothetical protein